MLMIADRAAWSVDPQTGWTRCVVPISAATARMVLTIDGKLSEKAAAAVEIQCAALTADPIVRHLHGSVSVDCSLSTSEQTSATVALPDHPDRMTARCFDHHHGLVGWPILLPASLAHPHRARRALPPLDLTSMADRLGRGEIDPVLDDLSAVWVETSTSDRSAATALLFKCLAEHPLKRSVVLGALMASLCDFRTSQ